MSSDNLNKWKFNPIVRSIGLKNKDYSVYALRHTSVTLLLAAGLDVKTIAEKHGTSPDMIWNTYGHVLPSMRANSTAMIAAALY